MKSKLVAAEFMSCEKYLKVIRRLRQWFIRSPWPKSSRQLNSKAVPEPRESGGKFSSDKSACGGAKALQVSSRTQFTDFVVIASWAQELDVVFRGKRVGIVAAIEEFPEKFEQNIEEKTKFSSLRRREKSS